MVRNESLHNGNYHRAHEIELEDPAFRADHEGWLRKFYANAMDIVEEQGWAHPLLSESPRVLQMGSASAVTANTFVDFVHGVNPHAQITIADFEEYPLKRAVATGLADRPNVHFVATDTTSAGFKANSFDLIETDGLLQYLNPDEKIQAIGEWYRMLKPGGVFTTRDRFISITASRLQRAIFGGLQDGLRDRFDVETYPASTEVIRYRFNQQGFDTHMQGTPFISTRSLLLHDIVARKPLK